MVRPGPNLRDQSVVVRIAIEEQAEDLSAIRILLNSRCGKHITAVNDLNVGRSHLIHVLSLKRHMQRVRPDVPDQSRETSRDLLFNVEIVIQRIGSLRMLLDVVPNTKRGGRRTNGGNRTGKASRWKQKPRDYLILRVRSRDGRVGRIDVG